MVDIFHVSNQASGSCDCDIYRSLNVTKVLGRIDSGQIDFLPKIANVLFNGYSEHTNQLE